MNLTIDAGNSRVKTGVFDGRKMVEIQSFESVNAWQLQEIFEKFNIRHSIITNTRDLTEELRQFLEKSGTLLLTESTKLPISNLYETPETLGRDRLAGAIAAYMSQPGIHHLIFDLGTAMTINYVNQNGEFMGGNISPGFEMRLKAMHHFTDKLPLVSFDNEPTMFGVNTRSALSNGALHGVIAEVQYYTAIFSQQFEPLQATITGGNSDFIHHYLDDSYVINPDLVTLGLNEILLVNV